MNVQEHLPLIAFAAVTAIVLFVMYRDLQRVKEHLYSDCAGAECARPAPEALPAPPPSSKAAAAAQAAQAEAEDDNYDDEQDNYDDEQDVEPEQADPKPKPVLKSALKQ